MKIQILSRERIERLSEKGFLQKTAVISICDTDLEPPLLKNKPEYLLQLKFNDMDNDVFIDENVRDEEDKKRIEAKYHMFTDSMAKEVAGFYKSICDKTEILICQCEHSQSRSAAIGAAIIEYRSRSGIRIFADDNYYPNKTVFRKTLKELKE